MINFRATTIKLLIFLAITGLFGVTVISTLTGPNVGDTDNYHAIFGDVSGLHEGDPVRVSGVEVGSVESEHLVDATHVNVEFSANRNQTLTTSTYAVVRYANLLGQRFLALTNSGAPGRALTHGATIVQSHTKPALSLTALFNGFQPLFQALDAKQINKFSSEIIQVLQGEGGTIDDLLSQTAQLTQNLADRDDLFVSVVDNLSKLLHSVAQHDDQLGQMVDSLDELTTNLAADSPNIGKSIDAIDGLMGSVGHLLSGLEQHNLHGNVIDLAALTQVVAKNSGVLDQTIKAFPVAFGDFNRVTQNGNWINAYACNVGVNIPLDPSVTANQIASLVAAYLGDKNIVSTVLNFLGGLLPGAGVTVPLDIPQGQITPSPVKHSSVCR